MKKYIKKMYLKYKIYIEVIKLLYIYKKLQKLGFPAVDFTFSQIWKVLEREVFKNEKKEEI